MRRPCGHADPADFLPAGAMLQPRLPAADAAEQVRTPRTRMHGCAHSPVSGRSPWRSAPSPSDHVDVRPALRASRLGVDAFNSHRDLWTLGYAVARIAGNADDRSHTRPAGLVGFHPPVCGEEDLTLVRARFRQYDWEPAW